MVGDPSSETGDVRPDAQLDWPSLETWLRERFENLSGRMDVVQFTAGHANLTYCVSFGPFEMVVRRPPHGVIAPGAHDMKREHRVLAGLSSSFDRAPRPLAFCDDVDVIGAPFIVIERRRGVVVRAEIPESLGDHPNVAHRISMALVDAMVALHAIDPSDVGLESLGRPDGFMDRQLSGWHRRWELARETELPLFSEVHRLLVSAQPPTKRHCIVHNDLKLDNCMFAPDEPDRVQSVFDWDMATLGDPLAELGTLLGYWREAEDEFDRAPTIGLDMRDFPTRQELVQRYRRSGFPFEDIEWYESFALWKTAVVFQQLHARFVAGESEDVRLEDLDVHVPILLEGARSVLHG
jgi:aminoglycoside phosphotransferase (APT) family kinase protein